MNLIYFCTFFLIFGAFVIHDKYKCENISVFVEGSYDCVAKDIHVIEIAKSAFVHYFYAKGPNP